MQNNWVSWLLLTEFACNNQVNNSTNILSFFMNYDFHLKMSIKSFFSCLLQIFKIFQEEFFNANLIANKFQKILNFVKSNIILAQKKSEKYANQYWFVMSKYKMKNEIWLNMKNVKTEKSAKKSNDKFKNFFSVIKIDIHTIMLKLSETWRIFNIFHTDQICLKKENSYSE